MSATTPRVTPEHTVSDRFDQRENTSDRQGARQRHTETRRTRQASRRAEHREARATDRERDAAHRTAHGKCQSAFDQRENTSDRRERVGGVVVWMTQPFLPTLKYRLPPAPHGVRRVGGYRLNAAHPTRAGVGCVVGWLASGRGGAEVRRCVSPSQFLRRRHGLVRYTRLRTCRGRCRAC